MSKRTQMTKKDVIDLLSYIFILAHNNKEKIREVITEKQFDKLLQISIDIFDNNEDKAISFIIERVKKLIPKLDSHQLKQIKQKSQ